MYVYMQGLVKQESESGNHQILLITVRLLLFKLENKKELPEEVNKSHWCALRRYVSDNIPSLI